MQPRWKLALLLGVAFATGTGAAIAEMKQPAGGTHRYANSGRAGSHFLADYDANHDGKVTRDEFNRAIGLRFAAVTSGAKLMTAQQFATDATKRHLERQMKYFRKADWNADGKVSLDEYTTAMHARFAAMDRNGTGFISCAHRSRPASNFGDPNKQRRRGPARGLCTQSDQNMDGRVTRAEFDVANMKRFNEAAHGARVVTFQQFASIGSLPRFADVGARIFKRLDTSNDGKLTLAEYAASQQRTFTRLDRNNDGVVTRDELAAQSRRGGSGFTDRRPRGFATRT